MDVLIIEDYDQSVLSLHKELTEDYGYNVTHAFDPLAVDFRQLPDVVVVDLLYQHLLHDFEQRIRRKEVTLSSRSFLVSGLAVLEALKEHPQTLPVIWSSGEASRVLHLALAYQEYNVRAFCAKGGPKKMLGTAGIIAAIETAKDGRFWADQGLACYLPQAGLPSVGELLFCSPKLTRIWRALALGATSHPEIARLTGYSQKTTRNALSDTDMMQRLAILDPGIDLSGQSLSTLTGFASRNWPFFLDETVVRLFPHE